MKLAVQKREAKKKTNQLRREGFVPAILYGQGQVGEPISIKKDEIQAIIRNMKAGLLATTVFELQGAGKAVVKEIQYHPASYEIEHIDFAKIEEDRPVEINVPVQLVGSADCTGIKLGGFLRQVIRTVKVKCLPKHIPQEFNLDVREMDLGASKRVSDIATPAHVKVLVKDLNQVVVVVGKKAGT